MPCNAGFSTTYPVAGDGKVYLVSEKGVVSVLKAGGEWEVISSRDLMERTVATPVVSGGKLFVRSEVALYCFGKASGGR